MLQYEFIVVYNARVFGINHIFRERKISFLTDRRPVDPVSLTNNVPCVTIRIISCIYFLNTREYTFGVRRYFLELYDRDITRVHTRSAEETGVHLSKLKTNYHYRRL